MKTLKLLMLASWFIAALIGCGGEEPQCTAVPLGTYDVVYTQAHSECEDVWKDEATEERTLTAEDPWAQCGQHESEVSDYIGLDCTAITTEHITSTDEGFGGSIESTLYCGPVGQALGLPAQCSASFYVTGTPRLK
jgi:hypothetical protein